jgi:hypothetical protein
LVAFLPAKRLDSFSHPLYNDFVLIDGVNKMYIAGNRKFKRLKTAVAYVSKEFARTGVVLGIEPLVVMNKNPGYIAYLKNGMKL